MSLKKILFVIPTLEFGGAERVTLTLAECLSKNYDVSVLVLSESKYKYSTKVNCIQINTKKFHTKIGKVFNIFYRSYLISKILKNKSPNLIVSFMESANIPSIFASLITHNLDSLVISVRNNPVKFPWFYKILIKTLYRFPHTIVAPSNGVVKGLNIVAPSIKHVDFIPNPIGIDFIQKMMLIPDQYSFDIPKNYILAVGSLSHKKGFDRLISIFARIKIKKLNLVIIGEGSERDNLTKLIDMYNLKERVIMPGIVKNPFYLYNRAFCLIMTSRYEGWPNTINEAIACSCPVISYNCNYGPSEILNHDNGFLIDEGDEDGVIKAVNKIYTNRNERGKVVKNGLKYIKNFSVDKIVKRWLLIKDIS